MRRRQFFPILGFVWILVAAAGGSTFAAGYTLPAEVGVPAGGEVRDSGRSFRPFGWSVNGRFAWLEGRFVDGRGGTKYTFVVWDAVNDKALYSLTDDSYDWPEGAEDSAEEAWRRSGDAVSRVLRDMGIVQESGIAVGAFPFNRSGDRLTVELSVTTKPGTEPADPDHVQSYRLTFRSRGRGAKVVTEQGDVSLTGVFVEGFVLSRFEPRILIIVGEQKAAFEGAMEDLRFFGAHLTMGFRK